MVRINYSKVLLKKNGSGISFVLRKNDFKVTSLYVRKTPNGSKQSVTLEDDVGKCHCWVTSEGLSVSVVTDMDYPE